MERRLAIFVSGTGSNARVMIDTFAEDPSIKVVLLVSNKADAAALLMASERQIPTLLLERKVFRETEELLNILAEFSVDFIALAGFLWLIPAYLVKAYTKRIVNIHPALLPKFGGRGMHGQHVHEAVKAAKETESGITIHYVNEQYDEGNIIFQDRIPIATTDEPSDIANKVLLLEHRHYASIVKNLMESI